MTSNLLSAGTLKLREALPAPSTFPSVCALISAHAEIEPGRTAIVDGGRLLTYGELELQTNRLAAELRGLGVGPGSCVAVFLERSPEAEGRPR
jgi:non-ribosomal peptide synthetase component F